MNYPYRRIRPLGAISWSLFYLAIHGSRCLSFVSSSIRHPRHLDGHRGPFTICHASTPYRGISIEGIVDDFDSLDSLHVTLKELRRQIPVLLVEPLTKEQASRAYTADTRLTAGEDDVELASSLDELLALSNTFLLAVAASTRAGNLLSTFSGATRATPFAPRVKSKVILVPTDPYRIIVEWETEFFSLTGGSNVADDDGAAQLIGYSELDLDPTSRRVSKHRLLRLSWNGQEQDARRIGQNLATLRRSVKSLQESPLAQIMNPVAGILDQVRNEMFQQLAPSNDDANDRGAPSLSIAPLFVRTSSMLDAPTGLCALDEYDYKERPSVFSNASAPVPIPGSVAWTEYAATAKMIQSFITDTIPALSEPKSSKALSPSIFAPDARLITLDGTVLLRDADRLVGFYKSLAGWRQRALVNWRLERVQVIESNVGDPAVQVDYRAESGAPGASSVVKLRGTDVFTLLRPENVVDDPAVRIQEIRQTKLSIGNSTQSAQESSLFFRSLATAVQTGRLGDDMYDGLWDDFLRRLTRGALPTTPKDKDVGTVLSPASFERSDAVAASVYRFMDSLLTECPPIVDMSRTMQHPPGYTYLSDNIALLGYLGETLLRGRSSYERSFGFSVASLKAALRAGQLVSEKELEVKVELNANRNVQLTLTFYLKAPPLINIPGLDVSKLVPDGGVPLKLSLSSEYVVDPESGMIVKHQLLESRINGQLTPGDIVSRWIQRQRGVTTAATQSTDDGESFMRGLLETVGWVRSMTTDGEKKK